MEWSEAHDILLAREVLASEPFRFKPRTVERGKMWQNIADRLNGTTLPRFRVTKRSIRDHFNLLLTKYKAKRRTEAKLSGVDVEDIELDTAMEEIWEKWEAAEEENSLHCVGREKAEADKLGGEDVRMKACEKLGETMKRKSEVSPTDQKPRKSRSGADTISFLGERPQQDIVLKQEELKAKQKEQERQTQLYEQFTSSQQQQQTQMMQIMQQQNQAMLALIRKFTQK